MIKKYLFFCFYGMIVGNGVIGASDASHKLTVDRINNSNVPLAVVRSIALSEFRMWRNTSTMVTLAQHEKIVAYHRGNLYKATQL